MQAKMEMEEEERKHANSLLNMDHSEKLMREKRENEERVNALMCENEEKLRYFKSLEEMGWISQRYSLHRIIPQQNRFGSRVTHRAGRHFIFIEERERVGMVQSNH